MPQKRSQSKHQPEPPLEAGLVMDHPGGDLPTPKAFWHYPENLLLTFFFGFMMVLPLLDILGRKLNPYFSIIPANIVPGSLTLVQHTVLAIMMFGGAIAAREGKLLALSSTSSLIPDQYKTLTRVLTSGFAAAITLYLAKASFGFAMIEREVGSIIACGIPKWIRSFSCPSVSA